MPDVYELADEDLYRRIGEILGQHGPVPADTEIAALPVDSFALVELVIELQELYGVRFGHDEMRALHTVGDLAALIRARGGRDG
ncbi:acyl carrier protein [Krasilnikovia sp. MM14-A1259]|uniref:acyl carrier protein n=1 Tax=Krasilnikovia sp. MM14-A1259 TaxID=3373539 RepID=UPI00380C9380